MRTLISAFLAIFLWVPWVHAAPKATPIINFGTPAPSVPAGTTSGTLLSTVIMTMTNGSSFSGSPAGTLTLTNSGGSVCALSGTNLNAGKTLVGGMFTCTVQATKQGVTVAKSITITVTTTAPATPTITLSPPSGSATTNTAVGTPLTTIGVMMSDGSTFSGTLAFGGSFGNGGGACALSSTTLPSTINLGQVLAVGTYNCSVTATQGTVTSAPVNFAITVIAVTPTVTLAPTSASIQNTTPPGTFLSNITVTMSDGSTFTGTLAFGGTFGNGGGACAFGTGTIVLGKALAAGSYNCSVTASQGTVTSAAVNFAITVAASATPTVTLTPSSQTEFDNTAVGTPMSTIAVTMSDGSTFTGTVQFGGTYGNGGGICAIATGKLTLAKPFPSGSSTQHCSVTATQGVIVSAQAILTITVVGPTPTVAVNPTSVSVPSTTGVGSQLAGIAVTMSDGSMFSGNLSLTNTGGGVCALAASGGTTLVPPTTNTFTNSFGVWGFDGQDTSLGGTTDYFITLNGVPPPYGGGGNLLLFYNNNTYAYYASPQLTSWLIYTFPPGQWIQIAGDPRPPGSNIVVGKALTSSVGGPYSCVVTATQNTSSTATLLVTVTSAATPTVTLGSPTVTIPDTTQPPAPLSTIAVSMSDGSSFTGALQLAGTFGNGGGACALSSTVLPANITLAKSLTAAGSPYHCTVVATQGASSSSANIAITVTGRTLSIAFNPAAPSIPDSTCVTCLITNVIVTVSDGSQFTGTLGFGGNDSSPGNYGNGGGVCALTTTGGGTTLVPPTSNTFTNSLGVWGFDGQDTSLGGTTDYFITLNGVPPPYGGGGNLLLFYNNNTYAYYASPQLTSWLFFNYPPGNWVQISGDPRSGTGSGTVTVGQVLTAGTYHCTITATQ